MTSPSTIESKINQKQAEINQIRSQITIWNGLVITMVTGAFAVSVYGIYQISPEAITWHEKLDSLGSFLSGTAGTLLAAASVIFIYSSLLKQQQQLLQQGVEIDLNLEELQQTREELKGQKEELEKQNAHWEQQRVEDMYFKLVADLRSIDLNSKDNASSHLHYDAALRYTCEQMTHRLETRIIAGDQSIEIRLDQIESSFTNGHFGPNLRWVQTLHVILSLLYRQAASNEYLMDHLCNSTPEDGKKLLFFYYKVNTFKLTQMKQWYLDSTMVSKTWNFYGYFD